MYLSKIFLGLALGVCLLPAQTVNVVVDSGYRAPGPLKVAPGQVITLFVRPATIRLTSGISADGTPLPLSLGGFSATLRQTFSSPVAVPILSVNPLSTCPAVNIAPVCSYLAALTVQIPFELMPNAERSRLPENFASVTVAENSVEGDPLQLNSVASNIHLVTSCDSTLLTISPPCAVLVKHSDGTLVTPKNQAVQDEVLTISAYGLGRTPNKVETGRLPLDDSSRIAGVKIGLRLGTNPNAPTADVEPLSAVHSMEGVGLYGISFKAPAPDKNTPACSETVDSNLAVTVGSETSSSSVSLCLRIPD